MSARELIEQCLRDASAVKERMLNDVALLGRIEEAAACLVRVVQAGGTIYACGNGGSACDAMHLVEELVARYKRERPGIRAMHFGDSSILSCWANDYDFASVFERCAETFCTSADALVAISTSGTSENVVRAVTAARQRKCATIALTGKEGGMLAQQADTAIVIPSMATERIQEAHIMLVHFFCEVLERG